MSDFPDCSRKLVGISYCLCRDCSGYRAKRSKSETSEEPRISDFVSQADKEPEEDRPYLQKAENYEYIGPGQSKKTTDLGPVTSSPILQALTGSMSGTVKVNMDPRVAKEEQHKAFLAQIKRIIRRAEPAMSASDIIELLDACNEFAG
jgi:hypothetical protein